MAAEAVAKGKGFAWALVAIQSRRAEAAEIALAPKIEDKTAAKAIESSAAYLREQAEHAALAKAEAAARKAQKVMKT